MNDLAQLENVPSYHVAIVDDDKSDIASYASPGHSLINRYAIGSLSKAFGAFLLHRMVKQGLCKWTDPMSMYYPVHSRVTLAQLLDHQVDCEPHLFTQMIDFGFDVSGVLGRFQEEQFDKAAISFQYNNIFYIALAQVLETISKRSVKQLLEDLCTEVGMYETGFTDDADTGYFRDRQSLQLKEIKTVLRPHSAFGLAGGIVTTIQDMLKWMQFMLKQTEFLETNGIEQPGYSNPPYRRGWWTSDEKRSSRIHTGSVFGFSSAIFLDPSKSFAICCLCNLTNAKFPGRVINRLVRERYCNAPWFSLDAGFHQSIPCPFDWPTLHGCFTAKDDLVSVSIDGTAKTLKCGNAVADLICVTRTHEVMQRNQDTFQVKWRNGQMEYYHGDTMEFCDDGEYDEQTLTLKFESFYSRSVVCHRSPKAGN